VRGVEYGGERCTNIQTLAGIEGDGSSADSGSSSASDVYETLAMRDVYDIDMER